MGGKNQGDEMTKTTSGLLVVFGLFLAVCCTPLAGAQSGSLCALGVLGGFAGISMFVVGALSFSSTRNK